MMVLCLQVIMQAQREPPPSYSDCKDKFLVQGCLVPKDAKDVSGDVFERATDVKQTKLRVVLTTPPKPPSPVPEGDEGDNSGGAVSIPAAREETAEQGKRSCQLHTQDILDSISSFWKLCLDTAPSPWDLPWTWQPILLVAKHCLTAKDSSNSLSLACPLFFN